MIFINCAGAAGWEHLLHAALFKPSVFQCVCFPSYSRSEISSSAEWRLCSTVRNKMLSSLTLIQQTKNLQ